MVKCQDGKERLCRVRGKLKRRVWIREGDIVLVSPWDFQSEKRGTFSGVTDETSLIGSENTTILQCESPKRGRLLRHKKSKGEYLALLSVKYGVNSEKLLAALRQAADEGKETKCCQFLVECRGKTKTDHIFSIKNASGIIAQFKVSNEFLVENRKSLKEFMGTDIILRHLAMRRKTSHSHFIKDVRPGINHVNLKAKVLAVTEPTHIVTRYGSYASVAKVLLADETGTINLCLWNEEIDLASIGATVRIVNAKVSTFKGEKQLTLGTRAVINRFEDDKSSAVPVLLPACKS